MIALGPLALWGAFVSAGVATVSAGVARGVETRWAPGTALWGMRFAALGALSAVGALLAALVTGDLHLRYVATHTHLGLDITARVAAVVGGIEGVALVALTAHLVTAAWLTRGLARGAVWRLAAAAGVALVGSAMLLLLADPFTPLAVEASDGRGLLPTLLTPSGALAAWLTPMSWGILIAACTVSARDGARAAAIDRTLRVAALASALAVAAALTSAWARGDTLQPSWLTVAPLALAVVRLHLGATVTRTARAVAILAHLSALTLAVAALAAPLSSDEVVVLREGDRTALRDGRVLQLSGISQYNAPGRYVVEAALTLGRVAARPALAVAARWVEVDVRERDLFASVPTGATWWAPRRTTRAIIERLTGDRVTLRVTTAPAASLAGVGLLLLISALALSAVARPRRR
ncbi:MAG: hypothetical protein K2X99_11560 [Gemmatimonadaceae bacterium]|nr:hypothetical protein [Gemmatimonadaceae bacterium]